MITLEEVLEKRETLNAASKRISSTARNLTKPDGSIIELNQARQAHTIARKEFSDAVNEFTCGSMAYLGVQVIESAMPSGSCNDPLFMKEIMKIRDRKKGC